MSTTELNLQINIINLFALKGVKPIFRDFKMNKQEFTELLNSINLAKKEFAQLANISYNTVNNWNDDNKPVPPWVKSWLENYIKAKVSDNMIEAIKPFIKDEK